MRCKGFLKEAKKVMIAGVGFFTDSYDLFVMNMLNVVFAAEYVTYYPDSVKTRLSTAALVGAIVGQIVFGFLADRLGRRLGLVTTSALLISGAATSAVGFWGEYNEAVGLFWALTLFRFVLGIGIGGEYPVAASVAAESADEPNAVNPTKGESQAELEAAATRGRTVLLVFSMQGVGNLVATAVVMLCLVMFGYSRGGLEATWRIAFGFGVIPVVLVLYFRLMMDESKLFENIQKKKKAKKDAQKGLKERLLGDVEKGTAAQILAETLQDQKLPAEETTPIIESTPRPDLAHAHSLIPKSTLIAWKLIIRMYGLRLLGTAGAWFLWDIVYYSNSLFSGTIISYIVPNAQIGETAFCQLILVLISLPGYFAAALLIDKRWLGRKRLQIIGLTAIGFLQILVGILFGVLKKAVPAFIILYAMVFFFYQFGPNSSTFVIPAEVFPTAIRARAHGLSAACGKAGAAVGAALMLPLVDHFGGKNSVSGPRAAFIACGILSFLTIPLTFLVPETTGRPLSFEDEAFYARLRAKLPSSTESGATASTAKF